MCETDVLSDKCKKALIIQSHPPPFRDTSSLREKRGVLSTGWKFIPGAVFRVEDITPSLIVFALGRRYLKRVVGGYR